jgi:hypothetical protein
MKRCGIEDRVSSGDTSSDSSKGLGDEVTHPLVVAECATTLEEDEAQSSGALIRGKDGTE